MSIIYALIAREDDLVSENGNNIHVLTEYSGDVTGNFPQVTRERVLKQVPKNRKSFYKYKDRYVFHSVNEDGFTYLCLADSDYPKTRAHVFLEELKVSFCNKYPVQMRQAAISYSLIGFSDTIKQKMEYYNNNKMDPKITKIRDQAGSTLNLMEQNMEAIIDRGETIELLVKKAGTLNVESGLLKERSATYKEQARKEALKRAAIIGGVVLVIVYMLFIRG